MLKFACSATRLFARWTGQILLRIPPPAEPHPPTWNLQSLILIDLNRSTPLLTAGRNLPPGTACRLPVALRCGLPPVAVFTALCCCFLLYTLSTFPRERCIVLRGLKFTKDYICSSTAEQCRGWGGGGKRGSLPCYRTLWWLPTHSDQSLWYALSPIRGWSIRTNLWFSYVKPRLILSLGFLTDRCFLITRAVWFHLIY